MNGFMQPLIALARFFQIGSRSARLARPLRVALACCFCLLLAACFETRLPDGVVATVNGEPISLRRLQTLLDSRSPSLGAMRTPTLENMRREYGEVLGTLIIYALVRQDLQRLQMSVSPAMLETALAEVRNDYGGADGLEKYLAEESIDPAEWRALLLDHLSMLSFEKRVLAAGIRVSLPELRDYYQTHEDDFQMPETLRVCLISGESRKDVEGFCAVFPGGMNEARSKVQLQCQNVRPADLPQTWRKAAAGLKPGQCAPVRQEEGLWRSLGLIENRPPAHISLAEAYPLVEGILREQKMSEAFERWLEKALADSVIMVGKELAPDLLAPPASHAGGQASDAPAVPDVSGAMEDMKALPPGKDDVYEGDVLEGSHDPKANGALENQGHNPETAPAAKASGDQQRRRDNGGSARRR